MYQIEVIVSTTSTVSPLRGNTPWISTKELPTFYIDDAISEGHAKQIALVIVSSGTAAVRGNELVSVSYVVNARKMV